jgi:malto-oligosyltrehalose synthase
VSVPSSTYRLQLRREFTFADAAAIVPYLADLGVSHVYCSPILQAVPGSAHGYDVIDHSKLSDDLGGDAGWQQLVAACRSEGLRLVVDIVPNHMAKPDPSILNGHWFDIDWPESERTGQLVYRRFFDVGSLIGVRVEEPDVFDATHARILDAVRAGEIDGLRIDHPDGLADPGGYLDRLATATGGIWTVAEKILEPGEDLPRGWKCAGTTGYDAIVAISSVLLDQSGSGPLTDIYRDLAGQRDDYETVVEHSKRHVVDHVLTPEVDRLVRELTPRAPTDIDSESIRTAVVEMLVALDVYRAYPADASSAHRIDKAAARAAKRAPSYDVVIHWLASILHEGYVRFEQTTGPVMAKGVEDTAFYRYLRLTALNEVGGDPGLFGGTVDQWHAECIRRATDWPHAMTTLTTHDTKRTEDVRARLLVLAEIPRDWADAVVQWRAAARVQGHLDGNTDYLFWQTLVGAWPLTVDRMLGYLEKATREAKTHTSWIEPNESYDTNLRRFTEAVFADDDLMQQVRDWCALHIDEPGRANALGQKLLQLTMPGVPDVYQGQELTAPALVDPDNRRPVDYETRRRQLAALDAGKPVEPKLLVTARTLRLRRDRPESFAGSYTPLTVGGQRSEHAIAYLRGDNVAVVVTRLPVGLARAGGFGDAALTLPAGKWRDAFTGVLHKGTIAIADLTAAHPVALLGLETG